MDDLFTEFALIRKPKDDDKKKIKIITKISSEYLTWAEYLGGDSMSYTKFKKEMDIQDHE